MTIVDLGNNGLLQKTVESFKVFYKNAGKIYEPRHEKTCLWGFPPGSAQTGLQQKMARGLNFQIKEVEGVYYL